MKIASFNINNINRRLTNLLNWLRKAEPDIVCLQELKAADAQFPAEAIRQAGYHAVCCGERRWNGVAILARWAPVVTRMDLPGDTPDGQCRYLEAAVNGLLVASVYAPNGNPQPGPKFDYKLAWLKRLNAHAAELYETGAPVVLAGDYNVVPTDLDIYSTKSWDRNALLRPESRAAYQRLLAQGWTDAIRALHPKEPMYTFWDYMRNRWERDGGLRLDHILLSSTLTERLQSAGVGRSSPFHLAGNRNAAHPVNTILNYAYAALESEIRIKAISDGYDPTIGIMHEGNDGSSKFVFDLMEPERPNVDRAVLGFVKGHVFNSADFVIRKDGVCRLNLEMARMIVAILGT
jgi:exodeoxyribonuclease-3